MATKKKKAEQSNEKQELRTRSAAELRSLLANKQETLQKLRFKHQLGQLTKTHELKELRRDVARIETIMRQEQRA